MTQHCPHCGQTMPGDALAEAADSIREWCRANGVAILPGDRIRQNDAARILDRSPKTLRNWASGAEPIPVHRSGGRAYHIVADIAAYLAQIRVPNCPDVSRRDLTEP